MSARVAAVIILAAGQGTRMRSSTPKVLHTLAGRTLLGHVLAATGVLSAERVAVVVGRDADAVTDHLAAIAPGARPVVQDPPLGTGHAVRVALAALGPIDGTVVVVPADAPTLTGTDLLALVTEHDRATAQVTALTAVLDDPTGYGRIVRADDGTIAKVVEEKDATPAERSVTEIATSVYAFAAAPLRAALDRITTDNAAGEEYLTDAVEILAADGHAVAAARGDLAGVVGVNDHLQLAQARRAVNDRILADWMRAGVCVIDPATTWVDADVEFGTDVTVYPNTQVCGTTRVDSGARIGPDSTVTDTIVGAGARVSRAECERAEIGPDASVGPYAYLRPGSVIGRGAKIGTYVEVKGSEIGDGTKVPHLTYVGDATVGEHTNIGASSVFVNYDGVDKHHTVIGSHVRTGADNMFIAPVRVGDGAYTAAGSVITEDVPPGALGVGRSRQYNSESWVERRRPGTAAARAAARARAERAHGDDG